MKRYTLFIFAALLSIIGTLPMSAQATQDALYIFRNDGKFNAFFYGDIDRIEYSKVDTLGVEHEDYVTQEVYALDSVFRIPISAIDSVAFVTPETQFKQDVAHTTESDMWHYVIDSDSVSWLLLKNTIPNGMVPNVGDKIVTLEQTNILPAGFVGKVASITTKEEGILVVCDEVDLLEIFDKYVCKLDAIEVSEEGTGTRSEESMKLTINIPELSYSRSLSGGLGLGNFSLDGTGSLGLSIKPRLDVRAFVSVDLDTGVNFDLTTRGELTAKFTFALNGGVTGQFDAPVINAISPVPGFPLFFFESEAGFFGELQGTLNFGGSFTTTERVYSVLQFNSLTEGNRQMILRFTHVQDTLIWSDVTAKVSISSGIYMQNSYKLISKKVYNSGVRFNFGLRDEIEAPIDWSLMSPKLPPSDNSLYDLTFQKTARTSYDFFDRNTALSQTIFANGQMFAQYGYKKHSVTEEITIGFPVEGALVPKFGKPVVRLATAASDSVHIDTPMEREVPFSLTVGYDIYNDQGKRAMRVTRQKAYYGKPETLTMAVGGLESGKKYIAYPVVEFLERSFYGEPTDSFTTDPAKLDIPVKTFNASTDNGTIDVKVVTNITNITFSPKDKWLSCLWLPDEQKLLVFHEFLPSTMSERVGTVHVTAKDGDGKVLEEADITIKQVHGYINLSSTELEFNASGGASILTIESTNAKNLKVSTTSFFIHPDINDKTISISVDENPSKDMREGTVIVSGTLGDTEEKVERIISITQYGKGGAQSKGGLFRKGAFNVKFTGPGNDDKQNFNYVFTTEGSTIKSGDNYVYQSSETKKEVNGIYSTEESWSVEVMVNPGKDKFYYDYSVTSASVSYLKQEYDSLGLYRSYRLSYNLKDLPGVGINQHTGVISFNPPTDETAATLGKLSDYLSNFNYEYYYKTHGLIEHLENWSMSQSDVDNAVSFDLSVDLTIADDVPLLESKQDSLEFSGREDYRIVYFDNNQLITDLEITTSEEWITIDGISWVGGATWGNFNVNCTNNKTKEDREGYVYMTGTIAGGEEKLTRTIYVKQTYDRIHDDDFIVSENQEAELPSDDILKKLEEAGMPLYLGTEPPEVNGTFKMTPLTLVYSNDPQQPAGETVNSYFVLKIASLIGDNPKASVQEYAGDDQLGPGPSTRYVSYLGGDGKHFTTSCIMTETWDTSIGVISDTSIILVSGEVDGDNIRDMYLTSIVLNEEGKIEYMYVGKDTDGLSTPCEWAPGADIDFDFNDDDTSFARKRIMSQRRQAQKPLP